MKTIPMLLLAALVAAPRAARAAAPEGAPGHESGEDAARAKKGGGASKGVKACHADIEKFCATVEPGEGRLGACLKDHRARLSKKCKSWLAHGGQGHEDEAFQELDKPANKRQGKATDQPGAPPR